MKKRRSSPKNAPAEKPWFLRQKTLEIHGGSIDGDRNLRPGLYRTTAFALGSFERGRRLFAGEERGFIYTRINNPSVDTLERRLATLEKGEACIATSSGMSAVTLIALHLASSRGHIVASNRLYGGVFHLFREELPKLGIHVTLVEKPFDLHAWEKAIRPTTKFLYVETPSNPVIDVFDIAALARIAHEHHIPLVVDSTLSTPALEQPLTKGADIVVHSLSKYMGDGEVIGGALVGTQELMDAVRLSWFRDTGPCISPDNAVVLCYHIESLFARMHEHCENALAVGRYLSRHPKVRKVFYPAFGPDARRNKKLMPAGFGGLMAFEVYGGAKKAKIVLENLKLFWHAPNIGEARSLIIHPATTTHGQLTPKELRHANIPEGMLRLSIGREDPKDLIYDLGQALSKI
ncbi:MAG: O-acetylhomoserine sulfhydrolase [Candidatus Kaiserbacteria bacterium GW2011_GWA2_52_12]|uniref:O-acetylhomoserine sulfhydrolase n=1 Tax=Candidatus Kaiserbacteria bacterium GW2011_GWA2_52_12 TaxID=1618671 RepID=A0A0G1ZAY5_9BACT|nr:MAG: O-acetylhomoserine sulfhydrolase [Candidatus Kaiserbacteria bacterium GW2011_GWA2_52_12]